VLVFLLHLLDDWWFAGQWFFKTQYELLGLNFITVLPQIQVTSKSSNENYTDNDQATQHHQLFLKTETNIWLNYFFYIFVHLEIFTFHIRTYFFLKQNMSCILNIRKSQHLFYSGSIFLIAELYNVQRFLF